LRLTEKSIGRNSITTWQTAETITRTNFYEEDRQEGEPLGIHDDGVNFKMNQGGDVGYLDRKVIDLEKKCASMAQEMERKDKGKAGMVDRLLMGTRTPFTRQVADYHWLEKFKVPQIQSYTGVRDPIEHFENFRVHLDIHGTPNVVACRAFPLMFTGNARYWFKRLPSRSVDKFEGLVKEFLG
jgi:hypothetical protein